MKLAAWLQQSRSDPAVAVKPESALIVSQDSDTIWLGMMCDGVAVTLLHSVRTDTGV